MTIAFIGTDMSSFKFEVGDVVRHKDFSNRVLVIKEINGVNITVYVQSADILAPSYIVKGRTVLVDACTLDEHYVLKGKIPPPPTGLRKPTRREIVL